MNPDQINNNGGYFWFAVFIAVIMFVVIDLIIDVNKGVDHPSDQKNKKQR